MNDGSKGERRAEWIGRRRKQTDRTPSDLRKCKHELAVKNCWSLSVGERAAVRAISTCISFQKTKSDGERNATGIKLPPRESAI